MSNIEWTEKTWNPITGCTKVSAGCRNCYAKTLHDQRHKAFLEGKLQNHACYSTPFEVVRLHEERLNIPLKTKKPTMFFVNSMSDLFHEQVPNEFIDKVFGVMNMGYLYTNYTEHIFQILTKRPERWNDGRFDYSYYQSGGGGAPEQIFPELHLTDNIWLGVSVENKQSVYRIELLKRTPAKVKFLSIEPLLEDLGELNLKGIDWVIVGGESGKNSRPMNLDWVRSIQHQCKEQSVKFFMKQLSQFDYPKTYKDFNNFPIDLQVREMPV